MSGLKIVACWSRREGFISINWACFWFPLFWEDDHQKICGRAIFPRSILHQMPSIGSYFQGFPRVCVLKSMTLLVPMLDAEDAFGVINSLSCLSPWLKSVSIPHEFFDGHKVRGCGCSLRGTAA